MNCKRLFNCEEAVKLQIYYDLQLVQLEVLKLLNCPCDLELRSVPTNEMYLWLSGWLESSAYFKLELIKF